MMKLNMENYVFMAWNLTLMCKIYFYTQTKCNCASMLLSILPLNHASQLSLYNFEL